MPRKKKTGEAQGQAPETVNTEKHLDTTTGTAVAELPQTPSPELRKRPDWIDGPPVDQNGTPIVQEPQPKNWGNPYKAIMTTPDFEMGEDRRFKQRLFRFNEQPKPEILATLKESGFTYRPAEKAWTIQATAATRELSDRLAMQFAGNNRDMSR